MSKNASGLHLKSFGDSEKDRYFSRLYNGWGNMFITIQEKLFCYFLSNICKTCQDGLKISRYTEIECLSHSFSNIFFRNSKHFKHVTKVSLTTCNFFPIFSIFLFLLVFFKLIPPWFIIYRNVWLRRNNHYQR